MQMIDDTRNVIDEFKGKSEDEIIQLLDKRGTQLEIAIENLKRDFNMGTIVRSANAFGVRHIHVIGSRQWNKRGAMATDKYLHVHYHRSVEAFVADMRTRNKTIIAVDNVDGATQLSDSPLPPDAVLVFGAEGPGISDQLLRYAKAVVAIEQYGSTRSLNVGVAAGVVMYEWLRRNCLRE